MCNKSNCIVNVNRSNIYTRSLLESRGWQLVAVEVCKLNSVLSGSGFQPPRWRKRSKKKFGLIFLRSVRRTCEDVRK